ncbi:MAG: hypothetical protein QT02_C0003G0022 [archaeon GW2011_AR9]|nr:MAG: hypothetical protein QT02_C0003G0022 [archaeon GW2011_AR9]
MYENNYKNPPLTGLKDLENFLQLLADLNEELELFAMGGTAMVLRGIKESTRDIDFLTTANYKKINELFRLAGLREENTSQLCNTWYLQKIRIDIFFNEFILGFSLPDDWKIKSEFLRTIGKVKLLILNWQDIIITKIARSESRDIEDCIAIIKHENINFPKLKERYYSSAETALIAEYDYKFKHLEYKLHQK